MWRWGLWWGTRCFGSRQAGFGHNWDVGVGPMGEETRHVGMGHGEWGGGAPWFGLRPVGVGHDSDSGVGPMGGDPAFDDEAPGGAPGVLGIAKVIPGAAGTRGGVPLGWAPGGPW